MSYRIQSNKLNIPGLIQKCLHPDVLYILLPGAELPLVESFGLLNDLFPFSTILDAGYPVLDLQFSDVFFDVILPSVLGSSL
jgi:hypothetical protein